MLTWKRIKRIPNITKTRKHNFLKKLISTSIIVFWCIKGGKIILKKRKINVFSLKKSIFFFLTRNELLISFYK